MFQFDFIRYYNRDWKVLSIFGLWIKEVNGAVPKWILPCSCIMHLIFTGLFNILLLICWILNSSTLKKLATLGYVIIITSFAHPKILMVIKERKQVTRLMKQLKNDLFQPKNQEELVLIHQNLQTFGSFRKMLMYQAVLTVLSSIIKPFFPNSNNILPFTSWYPFDVSVSPYFEIAYVHQSISEATVSIAYVFVDIIFTGVLTFIGLQCDLLCIRLRKIGKEEFFQHRKLLMECIEHHRAILKFLKTSDKLFGTIYFWQLFASTLTLCMDLFLISVTEPKTFEFFYLVVYVICVANLLLAPCWFATEMTRKSENIPIAAYGCDWTDASTSFQKDLKFFIQRSQRPLMLYAANFFEISVETFVKIIRASFSYYAVLNNLNAEKGY